MSEADPTLLEEVAELAERYVLGELDAEQLARLERLLVSDASSAQAMHSYLQNAGMMRVVFNERQRFTDRIAAAQRGSSSDSSIFATEVLDALRTIEASAEVCETRRIVEPMSAQGLPVRRGRSVAGRLSGGELVSLSGFALRWLMTRRPVALGAAAAVLLGLALVLVLVNQGGRDPLPRVVLSPTQPQPPTNQAQATVVATLTKQRDAVWASGRRIVGQPLYPGDTLTLNAGYAELTTARGAKAILQGPTTIAFSDDANALRLVSGRLVGVCETESSRQFTVHTPDARVTDLGTRFGVVYDGVTRARVLQGEVSIASTLAEAQAPPLRLTAGQAARIEPATGRVIDDERSDERFVAWWQAIDGTPRFEGDIRYESTMPGDLRNQQTEADVILLWLERSGVRLTADFEATFTGQGYHDSFTPVPAQALGRDVVVDSYFIHMDPPGKVGPDGVFSRYQAVIRFDRPVIGVIATSAQLADSHALLGLPGVRYGSASDWSPEAGVDVSGLERSSFNPMIKDTVTLSEDRQTLTLDLFGGQAIDQLRVLVRSSSDQ